MSKKVKIIFVIIGIVLISVLTYLGVTKVIQNENIKQNEQSKIENSKKYEKLEDMPLDYDFVKMVEDKCYIVTNSNVVYHIEQLDNFIKNVESNIPDEIRIVQYTIEGQPILTNLEYTKDKYILKRDARRDGYAAQEDKKITTTEYDASVYKLIKENTPNKITDLKTAYSIDLKSAETEETIAICSYVEIKQTAIKEFEIQFNKTTDNEEVTKILDKSESNKYNYNIYSYKGTVGIIINGEKMSLREALLNDKITIDKILEKAEKDAKEDRTILRSVYMDGGSRVYIYNDYTILKCNTISGDKDLYIGVPSMYIDDVRKLTQNTTNNKVIIKSLFIDEKVNLEIVNETKEIETIINNLQFKEETCDGLSSYEITLNNGEIYGFEIFSNEYHITNSKKGEAILREEEADIILEIINKYK